MFVFLTCLTAVVALENVALNKPAQQVSDNQNYYAPAGKAVDGNTDGNFLHGFCTHTKEEVQSTTWWKVDLMGFFKVTSIQIFTRTDCCGFRLQKFEVRVSLTNPVKFPSSEGQQCFYRTDIVPTSGLYVNCTQPIIGRYVSLYKATLDALTLCELRVFADKAVSAGGCLQSSPQQTSTAVTNSLTACAYSVVMDNFRVVANVSESFKTVSTVTCAARCAQNEKCFFFNIMTSATGSSRSVTCELVLSLSATVTESNLVPQNGSSGSLLPANLPFLALLSLAFTSSW